ncbi:hypothetical protein RhiirA5_421597 [Rhizophagus irregularis]|uniref:Uncharacterized protein n=1 Tax=Rhizophagus irregularis TaxID=588596 RepID=A0A2I1EM03_9GLOM|nr:hypothetical protein RhiirA5_421597 [Rhizophagus irregularis]PKY23161.1 hypothetical protein RhiirB3_437293 [Rhizophagus irregularis]PKY27838.1 hypothetical protein RhiirB3_443713 [Rhizophagus irregularis]
MNASRFLAMCPTCPSPEGLETLDSKSEKDWWEGVEYAEKLIEELLTDIVPVPESKNEDASRGLIYNYFDFWEAIFKRYKELKPEHGKDGFQVLVKSESREAIPEVKCSDEALRKRIAPLEVSSKLTSRRKRSHFAKCNDENDVLLSSYCEKIRTIVVNCILPDGTIDHFTIACEADEICVDYDDQFGSAQALCIENPYIRTWTGIENKLSCSSDVAYVKAGDVHTGVNTYYDNGDTANVYELQTFRSSS